MRFGIIALQVHSLIPQNMSFKDLLNHMIDYEYSNSIEYLVKAGFRLIELSGDIPFFVSPFWCWRYFTFNRSKESVWINLHHSFTVVVSRTFKTVKFGSRGFFECDYRLY
jgi:hypothetical protein